jgi:nicotinic acid mononucleotide adenylyltransferase
MIAAMSKEDLIAMFPKMDAAASAPTDPPAELMRLMPDAPWKCALAHDRHPHDTNAAGEYLMRHQNQPEEFWQTQKEISAAIPALRCLVCCQVARQLAEDAEEFADLLCDFHGETDQWWRETARARGLQDLDTSGQQVMVGGQWVPVNSTQAAGGGAVQPGGAAQPGGMQEELWPQSKLLKRCTEEVPARGQRTAILIMTGALNPVHSGHVQCLQHAREACEAEGIAVLGGYLSPSHDAYVRPKMDYMRQHCWPAPVRVEACEAAVKPIDWISVGRWEALGPHQHWPDFPDVCRSLSDELKRSEKLKAALDPHSDGRAAQFPIVYYVCGYDHFIKCGLGAGMGQGLGLAVLPRDADSTGGVTSEAATAMAKTLTNPANRIVGCPSAPLSVSSTLIRQALADGKPMHEGWLPAGVLEVLHRPR